AGARRGGGLGVGGGRRGGGVPLGGVGDALDEPVRQAGALLQLEGVVEVADGGAGLVAEGVAGDGDDLVELRVLGRPAHPVPLLQVVHLGPAHRDDVDGAAVLVAVGGAGRGGLVDAQAAAGGGGGVPLE